MSLSTSPNDCQSLIFIFWGPENTVRLQNKRRETPNETTKKCHRCKRTFPKNNQPAQNRQKRFPNDHINQWNRAETCPKSHTSCAVWGTRSRRRVAGKWPFSNAFWLAVLSSIAAVYVFHLENKFKIVLKWCMLLPSARLHLHTAADKRPART